MRLKWVILFLVIGIVVGWWVGKGEFRFSSRSDEHPKESIPLPQISVLKVAIVLDDWGYNLNNLPILREIHIPMTIAILPHLRFSAQIAESLQGKEYEIILHMPMEAHNGKIRAEARTLYTSMSDDEIRKTLEEAIQSVPYINGISNHMGSKATEDPRVMRIVMEELQREKLYFLDSLVTPQSVAEKVSKEIGLAFAERNVFLDNLLEPEYIKGQILKMVEQAKKNGHAIGIGHDRSVTLKVIQELVPELQKQGIQFVQVSELTSRSPVDQKTKSLVKEVE